MVERPGTFCPYMQFPRLGAYPELVHAVFTRRGGVSEAPYASLNLSGVTGDDPEAVRRNIALVHAELAMPVVYAIPVHGTAVAVLERPTEDDAATPWHERLRATARQHDADAMVTDVAGVVLLWAFADCVPLLFYDPGARAIGMAHAGWRGTAGAVARATVQAFTARFGTDPADLLVGIGPAIGACCYEVREEVVAAFQGDAFAREHAVFSQASALNGSGEMRTRLDVAASNERQLLALGVLPEHIERSGYCTGCRSDLFYSNRCESARSGRFGVAIGLRAAR